METLEAEVLDSIEPFSGEGMELAPPVVQTDSGLLSTDQARAVAEVQAAMVIARANPRDEHKAYLKIKKACQRKSLAMQAQWAFKRGGKLLEGPSIRIAEVVAGAWGNINYGFRELSRTKNMSEVEAFAWDLETNTKAVRQLQVRHWRDTREGGKEITAERDKYEYVAGMAQRRVRSCILEIIPGDIVDAAIDECKKTLQRQGDGRTFSDQVRDMIVAFDAQGVTKDMIEGYLQHKVEAMVPQQFYSLIKIYNSIKDGIASREEFFKAGASYKPEPEKQAGQTEPDPTSDPFINENLSSAEQIAPKQPQDKIYKGQNPKDYEMWVRRNWMEAVDVATPISAWKGGRVKDVQKKWTKMGLRIQDFPTVKAGGDDQTKGYMEAIKSANKEGEGEEDKEPTLDAETQEFLANAQGFYEELHESGEWDRVLKAFAIENPKDLEANMRRAFLQTCNARLDKLNEKKGGK